MARTARSVEQPRGRQRSLCIDTASSAWQYRLSLSMLCMLMACLRDRCCQCNVLPRSRYRRDQAPARRASRTGPRRKFSRGPIRAQRWRAPHAPPLPQVRPASAGARRRSAQRMARQRLAPHAGLAAEPAGRPRVIGDAQFEPGPASLPSGCRFTRPSLDRPEIPPLRHG